MFSRVDPFVQFGRRHYGEHSCKIILNLDKGFRGEVIERKKLQTKSVG